MITSYHRPRTLDEALTLLARPDTVALAGGTTIVAERSGTPVTAIDLQALPLDRITTDDVGVRIGAMARLQDVADSEAVPDLIGELATREAPRSLRNAATLGGTVAVADPESELVTALLAHAASVAIARPDGSDTVPLADLFADSRTLDGVLITEILVPAGGRSAAARTGRTPSDRPIVAAVAHRGPAGTRVAIAGVADRPVLVDPDDLGSLDPPSDFRGSAAYRRRLAAVLVERVLAALGVAR